MFWGSGFQSTEEAFFHLAHCEAFGAEEKPPILPRDGENKAPQRGPWGGWPGSDEAAPSWQSPFHPYLLNEKPQSKSNGQFLCVWTLFNLTPGFVVRTGPRRSCGAASSALPRAPSNTEPLPLATYALLAAALSVSSPRSPGMRIYLNYIGEHMEGHRDPGSESEKIHLWGQSLCNLFGWPWKPPLWRKKSKKKTKNRMIVHISLIKISLWASSSPDFHNIFVWQPKARGLCWNSCAFFLIAGWGVISVKGAQHLSWMFMRCH